MVAQRKGVEHLDIGESVSVDSVCSNLGQGIKHDQRRNKIYIRRVDTHIYIREREKTLFL